MVVVIPAPFRCSRFGLLTREHHKKYSCCTSGYYWQIDQDCKPLTRDVAVGPNRLSSCITTPPHFGPMHLPRTISVTPSECVFPKQRWRALRKHLCNQNNRLIPQPLFLSPTTPVRFQGVAESFSKLVVVKSETHEVSETT